MTTHPNPNPRSTPLLLPESVFAATGEVLERCSDLLDPSTRAVMRELYERNQPLNVPRPDAPRQELLDFIFSEIKRHPARTVGSIAARSGLDKELVWSLVQELTVSCKVTFRRISVYQEMT